MTTEEKLAKLLLAAKGIEKFLDCFTDREGSELTGAYLSYEGQAAVDALKRAIKETQQ